MVTRDEWIRASTPFPPLNPLDPVRLHAGVDYSLDTRRKIPPSKRPDVVLFSGGLDSLILWSLYGEPDAIYIKTGAPWESHELQVLNRLWDHVPGLAGKLNWGERHDMCRGIESDGHIPYRNLLLVTLAANLGYRTIALGTVAGETSRDKSTRFSTETEKLLTYLEGDRVSIVMPLRELTKAQAVALFLDRYRCGRQEAVDLLRMTRSCYRMDHYDDKIVGCGECTACLRRWVAMEAVMIKERYEVNPKNRLRDEILSERAGLIIKSTKYLRRTQLRDIPAVLRNQLDLWRTINNGR